MVGLIKKFYTFSHDIIFVDGLWGTGKSVIMPIIGGMDRMEKPRSDPSYEWLCVLGSYKKIEPDALRALLNTYADRHQYYNRIGREVNLRWADDTGLKNNPDSFKYVKRLFGPEGEKMANDIDQRNLGLLIMSAIVLPISDPLVDAFGSRLKIIEMVRHPLYIVRHWYNYLKRNPKKKEFTISFDYEGEKIPWFAGTWQEEYANCSLVDKCLASIIFLFNALFESIDKLKAKNQDILIISFESFVLEPQETLKNLESYLGRKHHKNIKAILKKQKVPRKQVVGMKGIALYGWKPSESESDAEEYAKQLEFICREGSEEYIEKFNTLILTYNQKWPSVLSQFQ